MYFIFLEVIALFLVRLPIARGRNSLHNTKYLDEIISFYNDKCLEFSSMTEEQEPLEDEEEPVDLHEQAVTYNQNIEDGKITMESLDFGWRSFFNFRKHLYNNNSK